MKALIVVDMEHDFMEGGALAVRGGRELISPVNALMRDWDGPIVVTQDWHPAGHCSFKEYGGPWPTHCVQGTLGAEVLVNTMYADVIWRKGCDVARDSYSAFFDNGRRDLGLYSLLVTRGVREVHIVGLARDFCVLWTAQDAALDGGSALRPHVHWALTASVDPKNDEEVRVKLNNSGVRIV